MSGACPICLGSRPARGEYHGACLRRQFGTRKPPLIDIELAKLHTLGLAMVGRKSLSGVQRKISVGLTTDRATLQFTAEGGRFILKPQAQTFPALPENEHLTMRLAERAGIEIPACGLVRLKDGTWAYLVLRFDRGPAGEKLRVEDFCQLAEKSPKEKYDASAELCVRLLRKYASEPLIEIEKLFRRLLFVWWTGNGDMHLKNFSLLIGPDGIARLSPAYDLLCTRLVIPDDPLALPVMGKKSALTRATWMEFGAYSALPVRVVERAIHDLVVLLEDARALIERSLLQEEMKTAYGDLLRERTDDLTSTSA